jgi:hypothetical protein
LCVRPQEGFRVVLRVKTLCQVVVDPPSASEDESLRIPDPTWEQIESAIRQLDRNRFPLVVLHFDDCRPGDPARYYLWVGGGRGLFHVHFGAPGEYLTCVDPAQPQTDERVAFIESGQQSWCPRRDMLDDIEIVLRVVLRVAETGRPDPSAHWQ